MVARSQPYRRLYARAGRKLYAHIMAWLSKRADVIGALFLRLLRKSVDYHRRLVVIRLYQAEISLPTRPMLVRLEGYNYEAN